MSKQSRQPDDTSDSLGDAHSGNAYPDNAHSGNARQSYGTESGYCPGCGRPVAECNGCLPEFDPPRFCPQCGKRMTVKVAPTAVYAVCKVHGELR